jgi:hypothetical protein
VAIPLPSYSQIVDLVKKGATLEAQEQIMKLREGALALQEENVTLTQEVQTLRNKCKALEEEVGFQKALEFKSPLYYVKGDETPYCAVCWERDKKAVHVRGPVTTDNGFVYADSNVCKQHYQLVEGRSEPMNWASDRYNRRRNLDGLI